MLHAAVLCQAKKKQCQVSVPVILAQDKLKAEHSGCFGSTGSTATGTMQTQQPKAAFANVIAVHSCL